ncbi:hypothetical protein [Tenacibaculum sp. SZ-18]|uniref:hypothetical protein n=1 Tax=Tenacibaculum sp. SZ-18 TaxID=754423 RepID=UPI000C2CF14B|nr:hypothetical protein [Tenacibaculum sp. SZ-18]
MIKIESEQIPLGEKDLGIRLLTQALVIEVSDRVEFTADSLLKTTRKTNDKIDLVRWKLYVTSGLRKTGFQTLPKLALADTWSYLEKVQDYYQEKSIQNSINDSIIDRVNLINVERIRNIARKNLSEKQFLALEELVINHNKSYTLNNGNKPYYKSLKSDFEAYLNATDSASIKTVGTLSEVVSDLTNRMDYASVLASKQLKWNTELLLIENGLDSLTVDSLKTNINRKLEKLIIIAENSPEKLDSVLINFKNEIIPLFDKLNYTFDSSVSTLVNERHMWDSIFARERNAYYTIYLKERESIKSEIKTISDKAVNDTMGHIRKIINDVFIYLLLIIILILFIPFGLGYFFGKKINGKK